MGHTRNDENEGNFHRPQAAIKKDCVVRLLAGARTVSPLTLVRMTGTLEIYIGDTASLKDRHHQARQGQRNSPVEIGRAHV